MSSEKRAPTEATVKVDPSIEIHKTLYPYINYKEGGLTPYAGTSDILKKIQSREQSLQWTPSQSNKCQPAIVWQWVQRMAPDGISQM